ncbi:MAG: hypothetical protein E7166_01375 [Firmicutes bacterium]|nr:hypothetical protein [Bacillota bacterium]
MKKIFNLLLVSIISFIPFVSVKAADYDKYTNYYLFYSTTSSWDITLAELGQHDTAEIVDIDGVEYFNNHTTHTAYVFDERIDEDSIIEEGLIDCEYDGGKIVCTDEDDYSIKIDYKEKLYEIFDKNVNIGDGVELEKNSTVDHFDTYYIHSLYGDNNGSNIQESYPFFWYYNEPSSDITYKYSDLTTDERDELKSDLKFIPQTWETTCRNTSNTNCVSINRNWFNNGYGSGYKFTIERKVSFPKTIVNQGIEMQDYYGSDGSIKYIMHPYVYRITYKVANDASKYNVTYHANNGTDNKVIVQLEKDAKFNIQENTFKRDGYSFVGWSTDASAKEADKTYNPGETHTISKNLDLYAVWTNTGTGKEEVDNSKTGLGYSIAVLGTILIGTVYGVVYFKKRNKFENI